METLARRKLPLWMRLAIGVMFAIVVLTLTGVALRYWITSDGGRAFIVSQIDGKRVGPLGVIRVSGLKGDPLTAATLADIALVDDDGVWLRARDAKIQWTPTRLFSGDLEIQAVDVRLVDVQRRPHSTYESKNRGAPDIGLKLDTVIIQELRIARGVLGPAASYSVAGGATRTRDGAGSAMLDLAPLTGPGDRVQASAMWTATGVVGGEAVAIGPVGGMIATLIHAPADKPVAFKASISGRIAEFKGDARLHFGNQPIASLDINRKGDIADLTATVSAASWPLLADVAERTGDAVKLEGQINLADLKRAPIQLKLTAPAGRVDLTTTANLETYELPAPAKLATQGLDLAFVAAPLTGKIDADGQIRLIGLTEFEWTGNATATSLTFPSGSAAKVTTPLTITKDGMTFRWEAPAAIIDGGRITSLKSLAPARYTAATRGDVNIRTRLVEITQAQIRGQAGDVSARGTYGIRSHALKLAGAASFTRLADVAPLTGSARGQWTVTRTSENAPFRITADAAGRAVGSRIAALAQLTGPEPRVKISAVTQNGRFIVESGSFDGAGLTANMTGRITDAGTITGRATGALRRPLSLGAASLKTLAFTANFSGKTAAPRLDINLANGAVLVAGLDLTGIQGDIDATLGKNIAGDLRLTGNADGQPLTVTSRIAGGDGDWRLTNLDARLGGLTLTAPQLAYADGGFSAAFGASGSLAGLADITRGTLSAHGQIAANDNGLDLDLAGQLSDVRRGAIRLQLATFEAKARDDNATLSGRVRGTLGTSVDIAFSADADRTSDLWSGNASLTGKVDELPVATPKPLAWTYGNQGWTLAGDITAFGGRITTDVASGPEIARTSLDLADIDLRALSRLARFNPVAGRLSGRSSFSNTNGVAIAEMSFTVADANPVGVTTDPMTLKLDGQLRNNAFTVIASGSGQGFDLDATALLPFETGEGFNVAPARTRPMQGRVTVTGRAEQLWALFGPEGQSLRGKLDADVRIAGTMDSPTLDGGFAVAEGAYEHGETGLRLRDITAKGEFNQHSATITDLSANDGATGRLTGEGDIHWNGSVTGGVRFIATNLRALGRDDRTAIVSGSGAVTLDAQAMHVTGDLTVSQARISIEQPASASIPTLPGLRRVNFPNQEDADANGQPAFRRPIELDLKVNAPRRIVVFGRGLDTEWSADVRVTGKIANPSVEGTATLVRGTLDLAGRRFAFDTGTINLDGPIRNARINISAERDADDIDAIVRVSGTPGDPKFTLESTPSLPQDEILARVLFGRSASELSALEAAQLAAGLAQLAGGQAGFDPAGLLRQATGLDRVAIGASEAGATVSAGKYIADDVYLQVGAGGQGGVGAEVEWEPRDGVSIISSAQGNGDTRIAVRWKKDY